MILIIVIIFAALIVLGAIVSGTGDSDKDSTSTKSTTKSTTKQAKEEKMTTAQKNAYQSAQDYLATAAFSRQGLIDQLTSDSGDGYDLKANTAINSRTSKLYMEPTRLINSDRTL